MWTMVVGLVLFTGCSDEEEPLGGSNFVPGDTGNSGQTEADAGFDIGPDVEAPMDIGNDSDNAVEDDIGEVPDVEEPEDTNGDQEPEQEYPLMVDGPCGPMLDFGELEQQSYEVTIDFSDFGSEETTSCTDGESGSAAILAFELLNFANFSFEADAPVAMGLRFDHCSFVGGSTICDGQQGQTVATTMGVPEAFLVIEPLDDVELETVAVTFELHQSSECEDSQERQSECIDENRARVCRTSWASPNQLRWEEGRCPGECDDGCVGDSCEAPLSVTPGQTIEVENLGLSYHYNHHDHPEPSCEIPEVMGEQTWGRELVLELSDLEAGDVITIDLDTDGSTYDEGAAVWPFVLLKESCSEEAACLDVWTDVHETMTYQVESAGDYFIIVDGTWHKLDMFYDIVVEIN